MSSWGTSGLFVVGSQSREKRVGLLGDTIGLINGAGFVGSVVFIIQALYSRDEAGGDTMLLVEIDGTLDCLVSKDITMGEVLGDDTASWLLLLGDLITVTLSVLSEVASVIFGAARGR